MKTIKLTVDIKCTWYYKALLEILPFFIVCNFFSYCTAVKILEFVARNGGIKISRRTGGD